MKRTNCLLACLLAVGVSLVANSSNAALVSYNIIQAQSNLKLTSQLSIFNGAVIQTALPQVGGTDQGSSDQATYTGTINADLNAGVNIQLLSANMIADLSTIGGVPINLAPAPGGAGSAPANYGFTSSGPIFTGLLVAARNIAISVNSGVLAINGLGNFPSNWTGTTLSGGADTNIGFLPLTGLSAANAVLGSSSVTTVGNIETLKLNYKVTYSFVVAQDPNVGPVSTVSTFQGLIFASRQVPEPGTLILGGMAVACLVPLGLRRRRQR